MEQTKATEADHLCVLVHGLWGNPSHLANVAKTLRAKHPEDVLHILVAKRNSGSFTYDGIELGGERVCAETEEEIKRLKAEGHNVKKLSIVGYSLGGLVGRYAVGLLYARGVFDEIQPVNFTTFATPHLGVRTPLLGWHNHIWNVFGARTLSMSGRQLFTIDNFRNTGRPLLSVLADPDSIFIKGLARFKRRTLYTNIVNDRTAVYYTTGVSKIDPFQHLEKVKINYLPGYDNVIVDPDHPVELLESQKIDVPPLYARLTGFLNRLPFMVALVILVPIGAVAFLLNSAFQTLWSSWRIRMHESGKAGIEIATYRTPLLVSMREAVEDAFENVSHAQENEYLENGAEYKVRNKAIERWRTNRSESPMTSGVDSEVEGSGMVSTAISSRPSTASMTSLDNAIGSHSGSSSLDVPTLALTPEQFAMIDALDGVGWHKFPVHIHKNRHSHAAIIVRKKGESFTEGYTVMRHWLEEEFLMP